MIDQEHGDLTASEPHPVASRNRKSKSDADRRTKIDRILRSLPKHLGFRDARSFARAFARANKLVTEPHGSRRRLTPAQIQELERRVLAHESPIVIARTIGCAHQTVLNRATILRKRLAGAIEGNASGI